MQIRAMRNRADRICMGTSGETRKTRSAIVPCNEHNNVPSLHVEKKSSDSRVSKRERRDQLCLYPY